ncbi:hypothetical protein J132_07183 [Termitomyces sp. J132]|nr:hypothetical protein J132_07183 [Termitomyces sp. J132]
MLQDSDLKGFKIPGHKEKLIANLFADDTTSFLSEEDDPVTLNCILDDWSIAARANFNASKIEVLPIGSKEFHLKLINKRRMCPERYRFPDSIHIVDEGTVIRILSAWFGNEADLSAPWTNVLEKVDKCLKTWEGSNPTLERRRLIAQMVIAGMTQYLTQVQDMPPHVEKLLT